MSTGKDNEPEAVISFCGQSHELILSPHSDIQALCTSVITAYSETLAQFNSETPGNQPRG